MLIIAVKRSSRPIFVPMFAILVATLILGGILQKLEPETFPDAFDSMYAIFWLLLTLGYDGDLTLAQNPLAPAPALTLTLTLTLTLPTDH